MGRARVAVAYASGDSTANANYFICGKYAKTGKLECRANSVRWEHLDKAAAQWLERVKGILGEAAAVKIDPDNLQTLSKQFLSNIGMTLLLFCDMCEELGITEDPLPFDLRNCDTAEINKHGPQIQKIFLDICSRWKKLNIKRTKERDKTVAALEARILKLGALVEQTTSPTLRNKWFAEIEALERERQGLASDGNLLERYVRTLEVAGKCYETLQKAKGLQLARVYDILLSHIVPIMKVETMRNQRTRTHVIGFRFEPGKITQEALGVLEIHCVPRGTDSARRST